MKRFWKYSTCIAVVAMTILPALTGNDNLLNAGEPPVKKDILLTPGQRIMLDNNNDFACNLFRSINEQKRGRGSFIVSPISVSYMLGMLNEGADGNTRRQISDVLGLGNDVHDINMYFKKMTDEAPRVDSKVAVKIANCIDVNSRKGISLIPQFEADMRKYYSAQVDEMDFTTGGNVDIINNWCKSKTQGMIPKILDKLDPEAAMYLLNAVYFKASWVWIFDPKETRDRSFTKEDGSTVKCMMMHRKSQASYGKNDLCEMLCMPYGSNGYSMYVLLPRMGKTVGDIIKNISAKELKKQRTYEMSNHEVDILIPRFTTENETDLTSVLSSMGMPLAFNERAAEFPNMALEHDDLYVSKMKQKAKIEVDEEGTKTAAVTVTEMRNRAAGPSSGYTFHATHPFVYYIIENSTGSIFFMGTYCGD